MILTESTISDAANYSPNNTESVAARAINSHSYRENTVLPYLSGKVWQKNEKAEIIVKNILQHPDKQTHAQIWERKKIQVVDISCPIGGLRYSNEYEFIGVLEP
jgi:ubiquinone/menaquinone biosynthesis C-methylase UbiE